jgi:hypothetical protein
VLHIYPVRAKTPVSSARSGLITSSLLRMACSLSHREMKMALPLWRSTKK